MGVTLTTKLNWNTHIEAKAAKCIRVFWGCRKIIGRDWGLSPKHILWIYTAIVRPMLTYGSLIWWQGAKTTLAKRTLNHIQRVACLTITGASNTTPQLALEALLNLPSLGNFIEGTARVSAYRNRKLVNPNDLRCRGHASILASMSIDEPEILAVNDGIKSTFVFDRGFHAVIPNREQAPSIVRDLMTTHDIWFTDASIKRTTSGYGIYNHNTGSSEQGGLGPGLSTKMAELTAIQICCVKIAKRDQTNTPLTICTDSQAAIGALMLPKIVSKVVLETVQLLNLLALGRRVTLLWTPARSGIQGNETADELARRGANSAQTRPHLVNLRGDDGHRVRIDEWLQRQTSLDWQRSSTAQHSKAFLQSPNVDYRDKLLELNKRELKIGCGMITGHIGLNAHLTRIRAREDPLCDRCNMGEESGQHFLCECPAWSSIRREVYGTDSISPLIVLDNPKKISTFADRTGRFAYTTADSSAQAPHPHRNALRRSMTQSRSGLDAH